MPTDKSSRPPAPSGVSTQSAPGDDPPASPGDALGAWNTLVEDWWRQHSESLPAELRRTLRATLDQSRAMWTLARGVPADDPRQAGDGTGSGAAPVDPAIGLWQPVLDALRTCEQIVLSGQSGPSRGEEYRSACGAYAGEFAKLNAEVARRISDKLARVDADTGFVELHRLMLEEAEDAYLGHVSTDEFARCQARFVNALFGRARRSREAQDPAAGDHGKA